MIKQIIKMAWSRRRSYIGIFIEQACVFIVLSFCLVTSVGLLNKLNSPGLLDTSDVVTLVIPINHAYEETEQRASSLVEILKNSSDVITLSGSIGFIPYVGIEDQIDSIFVDSKVYGVKVKYTDEYASKIFMPKFVEGNWLTCEARPDGSYPAVITKQLADQLGWATSLGKQISFMQYKVTIVGVIEGLKEEVLTDSPASLILPINIAPPDNTCLFYAVKLQKGTIDSFYSFYTKEFSKMYPELDDQSDDLRYISLDVIKNAGLYGINISITAMSLICLFIILYTFIGSYGLISLISEKRTGEFALHLALGLSKKSLQYHVILESLIVTLLSTVPGCVVILVMLYSYSSKMPIIISLIASILIMIIFSLFSAWYPVFKVGKLNPAEVLKNDL